MDPNQPRTSAIPILGSLVFFAIGPGTFAGLIPWTISGWRFEEPLLGWAGGRVVGGTLVLAGVVVLAESFLRFAIVGRGTPAPPLPTQTLVVSGLYRHVRNPMYLGVVSVILGQAALFGSGSVAWYGAVVWTAFHAFVRLYEEPTLRARYGSEYESYCVAVPRWLPRAQAWRGTEGRN